MDNPTNTNEIRPRGESNAEMENTHPIYTAIENKNLEEVERLLRDEGLDPNLSYDSGETPFNYAIGFRNNIDMIQLMIRYGADPRRALLHAVSDLELMKYLISLGADIHAINTDDNIGTIGDSVLLSHATTEDIELIQFLLDNGADVNYVNERARPGFKTFLSTLFDSYVSDGMSLEEQIYGYKAIDLALKHGANINLLEPKYKQMAEVYIASPKWAGFTQDDYRMFQNIFGERPQDYSQCPICLKHVERSEACMYMRHNCTELGGYYHQILYKFYKNDKGNVYWCTICGRSALGHRHYELPKDFAYEYETVYDERGRRKKRMKLPPLGPGRGRPFDIDCRLTNGGGGFPEKYIRFTTYITTAKRLNDVIGIMPDEVARTHLVEECFQAPRMDHFLVSRGDFPRRIVLPPAPAAAAPPPAPNVRKPNANRDLVPRRLNSGLNSVGLLEDVPVIVFTHRDTATGAVVAHGEDEYIGIDSLVEFIRTQTRNFAMPAFGYCYNYPQCKALLYPEDVREFLPADIYEAYKLKFNEKFRGQRGGADGPSYVSPYIQEATNASCALPAPATGGHKTRRRKGKKGEKGGKTRGN